MATPSHIMTLFRPTRTFTAVARTLRTRLPTGRLGRHAAFSTSRSVLVKRYTPDHEWIDIPEGSDIGTMGITKYAAHALGDVVFVELPAVDLEVSKGEGMGAVESVKSASDIMTPVTGTVVEVNETLESKPANINKDPEGEAWFARIKVLDVKEVEGLMDEAEYTKHTEEASAAQ